MRTVTEEEKALAKDLSACTFSHYKYFAAGALFGFPLSIHKKSYWPFTLAAVAGSAVDIMEAQATCKPQREALEQCIARQKTQKDDERTREAEQSPPLHEGRPQGGCKESSEGGQGDGGARNNAGRNSR